MGSLRLWLASLAAAGLVVGVVAIASQRQTSTADTNLEEVQAATAMQVAMLSQERVLDLYLASGQQRFLERLYQDRLDLEKSLSETKELVADDAEESAAVAAQSAAYGRWYQLARAAVAQRQQSHLDEAESPEEARGRVIDDFQSANEKLHDRLTVNRHAESRAATLFVVWVLLGLGGLFLGVAAVLQLRRRRERKRTRAFAESQSRFVEAIQFAQDEPEAHSILTEHLEDSVPGSSVLVLKRNNSADRLEPSRRLEEDHPLAQPVLVAEPRSCLAVRLSRRYDRGSQKSKEVLDCAICGCLPGPSSCQPLLVGGEVIGSVLVSHDQRLNGVSDRRLDDTVTQAAPVLANLRNLAIAENRAATDVLTGLPNRRSVDDMLRRLVAQADRAISPLSIVLLDLDHFKQINDAYGHDRGDDALAAAATLLRSELRNGDFAGRSGGEEFVLFLPDTNRDGAITVAEKLRKAMHKLRIPGIERSLTGSFGVSTFPDDAATPEGLMRIADRALYKAKQVGRDRVETAPPLPVEELEYADEAS
ncbi:MAG TPA: diguanylate cyclase [Gaiellaceae bacterium]|nr:diguanylate cyclase [Gaiellaceae bacterium]